MKLKDKFSLASRLETVIIIWREDNYSRQFHEPTGPIPTRSATPRKLLLGNVGISLLDFVSFSSPKVGGGGG